MKTFNLLGYFREHISDYGESFYIQHPPIHIGLEGWREEVMFVDHYPKQGIHGEFYVVKKVVRKNGDKSMITNVKRSQLFIHAK